MSSEEVVAVFIVAAGTLVLEEKKSLAASPNRLHSAVTAANCLAMQIMQCPKEGVGVGTWQARSPLLGHDVVTGMR